MRELPEVYDQNDPQWAFQPLGDASVDLGQDGCLCTSFADCACYYGKTTNPLLLDQAFEDNKIYTDEDLLDDNALTEIYPDIVYQQSYDYQSVPADLSQLKSLLSDLTLFVIVCIDMGGGNVHFSPVVSCDGSVVFIGNAWDGTVENFSQDYGDPATNILRFIVYKGTPTTQVTTGQDGGGTDQDAINAQKAVQSDQIVTYLNSVGLLPTNNSGDYLTNDGILNAVKALKADRDAQAIRAGWYDDVCIYLGYKGDTTTFNDTQVEGLIQEQVQSAVDNIGSKLKVPAGSSADAVATAIVELQQDEANASTTADNLNKQIPQLETELATAQGQVKTLTTQLNSAGNTSTEPSSGISYQELYNTLLNDYNTKKAIWEAQFATDVASFSMLKRTNIYYLTTGFIFSYWTQRISGQAKQNTPPPLLPSDFTYSKTVVPPVGT